MEPLSQITELVRENDALTLLVSTLLAGYAPMSLVIWYLLRRLSSVQDRTIEAYVEGTKILARLTTTVELTRQRDGGD